MATKFSMTRDINGYNGFGLVPSDTNYSAYLSTSTDTTLTIPSSSVLGGSNYEGMTNNKVLAVIFYTPGSTVWVSNNTLAEDPVDVVFGLTASMANPSAIEVEGGDILHFFTTGTDIAVSVRLYWL